MGTGCSSNKTSGELSDGELWAQPSKKNGMKSVPALKIAIVGNASVGKTSVFLRYIHNQFSFLYIPTLRAVLENVVKTINVPGHAMVSVTLWDIPGEEDINLYSSYFKNLDAAIVVVDLTQPETIEVASHWKEIILSNAVKTDGAAEDESETETPVDPETFPVLLLGNKYDLIEQQISNKQMQELMDSISPESENEGPLTKGDNSISPQFTNLKNVKPTCLRLLESVANRHNFVGSVAVSARDGDRSVHMAIQSFLRRVLEAKYLPRRWKPQEAEVVKKTEEIRLLQVVGIPEFDVEFDKANTLVRRIISLQTFGQQSLQKFQDLCVQAEVVTSRAGASLEDCIVGLRKLFKEQEKKLQLLEEDGFYVLSVKGADGEKSIDQDLKKIIQTFNKEYSAVCKAMIREFPKADNLLQKIDQKVAALCKEYRPQESQPGQQATERQNLKKASDIIENNRAKMQHCQQEARESCKNVENARKKAMAAFFW